MWLPRMIAWLSVIAGLLLLAVGVVSLLTGSYLAALQGMGAAFGALIGGSILLVLLDIGERLGATAPSVRPAVAPPPTAEAPTEAPSWMVKRYDPLNPHSTPGS